MKTTFTFFPLLIILSLISTSGFAQNDCGESNIQSDLAVNNVRARLKNGGDLWWDGDQARYIIPKVEPASGLPEVAAIFAGSLWLGGLDDGGDLKLAGQTYGSGNGFIDYFAGPLDNNGNTTLDQCEKFDQIWKTNEADILSHQTDWSDNGVIDGPIPESLLKWPGRLNPHFFTYYGFDLPDQVLAPFFDVNADGIYNPEDGDHPDIKNASEGQWMVFNDAGNVHTQTSGATLGVEVQLLAYAYASTNDAINNTTFYDYTIINKSGEALYDAYAALWVDADLGCYTDDYIGCSPQKNLAFVYNMDETDGSSNCICPGGVATYCNEIPVVGIKMLEGVYGERVFDANGDLVNPEPGQTPDTIINIGLSSFLYYVNASGTPSPPDAITDPEFAQEYYNLMSGHWKDGTALTSEGNGYNPGSTTFTNFAFPGNPSENTEWSMCSEDFPTSDPRMVLGSGPFTMHPGSINKLSFAVIYEANVAHPCPDISGLEAIADQIENFYNNTIPSKIKDIIVSPLATKVIPNPFQDQAQIVLENPDQVIECIQLFSIDGRLLKTYDNLFANQLIIHKSQLNAKGMFLYKIKTRDGKIFAGKIVAE